jgi:putative ABC transport system permease protein
MNGTDTISPSSIPEQSSVSWALALSVGWGSLKRRLLRSMVTMLGVVLAIAFLTYMLVSDRIVGALVGVNDDTLNRILQEAGVEIFSANKTDSMMVLLLSLSLLTCLVGIINSMLMAVSERIKEIGTLKCLGALDSFIVKTYLIESSVQGLLGTMLGIAIGLVVALVVSLKAYGVWVWRCFPVLPVLNAMGLALMLGAVISIGAAIIPAYLAAKKEPVEAMRVDS